MATPGERRMRAVETTETGRAGYVLAVGDDGPDRNEACAHLAAAGVECSAGTDEEILAVSDWVPPKLVIMDDSGGREARMERIARLLKHPPFIGVPLLVIAYDADIDSFSGAITKGAAAYLVEPVNVEELVLASKRLSGWQGTASSTEKRRRLRRPLLMKIDLVVRSSKLRMTGEMVDASGTGCRVEMPHAVAQGELVRVILHAHENSTHLALGAEVRWHRQAADGKNVLGLRFTGTTALLAGKSLGFDSTGST